MKTILLPYVSMYQFISVQFSLSVVSDSLRPHESQHARPPCPSPSPGGHSDSRPSSLWCHPSHLILGRPLLLLPPIPPSIRVFSTESTLRMRWPKYWSFSFSIIPSNFVTPDWLMRGCVHRWPLGGADTPGCTDEWSELEGSEEVETADSASAGTSGCLHIP